MTRAQRLVLAIIFSPLVPQFIIFQGSNFLQTSISVQHSFEYVLFCILISYLGVILIGVPVHIFLLRRRRTEIYSYVIAALAAGPFVAAAGFLIVTILKLMEPKVAIVMGAEMGGLIALAIAVSLFSVPVSIIFWIISRPDSS